MKCYAYVKVEPICPPPSLAYIRECAKLAWLMKLYTTILYSTGVKVVVNTTVGQLGAV